ncbi:Endonuclease/exonuclease/phosphatase [Phycomyces blakesleeanus]|uniref:Endonuclease/exonuclease/phosphatase n=1 Tax=Phycomyces blakesleeanus TaxID=4837 RepID=A0ABR3B9F7_PHYBL
MPGSLHSLHLSTNSVPASPERTKTFAAVHNLLSSASNKRSKTMAFSPKSRPSCHPDRLKVFVGTWNMYGRLLPIELDTFLTRNPEDPHESTLPHLDSSATHPYHLLAIGTQECERDISESLFYSSKEVWEERLSTFLGKHYALIETETLAALHLAVFVWKPVRHYITNIESEHIKTGWANMVGNKGAVAISFMFGPRSLLFINCHLTAHASHNDERNANVSRILHDLKMRDPKLSKSNKHESKIKEIEPEKQPPSQKQTKTEILSNNQPSKTKQNTKTQSDSLSPPVLSASSASASASSPLSVLAQVPLESTPNKSSKTKDPKQLTENNLKDRGIRTSVKEYHHHPHNHENIIKRFDHTFIFGDTNYRVDAERSWVLETLQKGDYKAVLKYDQLTNTRKQPDNPFEGFQEHPINFPPTFKFDTKHAHSISDTSSSIESEHSPVAPEQDEALEQALQTQSQAQAQSNPQSKSKSKSKSQTKSSLKAKLKSKTKSKSSASPSPSPSPSPSLSTSKPEEKERERVAAAPGLPLSLCYDSSPKQRVPSWTDRILWHDGKNISSTNKRTKRNGSVVERGPPNWWQLFGQNNNKRQQSTECWSYGAVMDDELEGVSDHLPVIGVFGIHFDAWVDESNKSQKRIRKKSTISQQQDQKASKGNGKGKGKAKRHWWKRVIGFW